MYFPPDDPKRQKFYAEWLTAQRVAMFCEHNTQALVMKLGEPDDPGLNVWNQSLRAPSKDDLRALLEFYLCKQAAEHVRDEMFSLEVTKSGAGLGPFWVMLAELAPHLKQFVFYPVVFLAALTVLIRAWF